MKPSDIADVLVSAAPDAILYADRDGIIRMWNRGCVRIFGFAEDEAVGQSLDIIIPENLRSRHWLGYTETMSTGQTRYGAGDLLSVPAIRKDGTRISVEFSITPFRSEDGRMLGLGAIMRDITERFEEMKALRMAAGNAHGHGS